jgi:hypothetical protein
MHAGTAVAPLDDVMRVRRKGSEVGRASPPFWVTVRREVSGTSTRLFEYLGDPLDDQLEMLLEHVTQLLTIEHDGMQVSVIFGCELDPTRVVRLAEALLNLQRATRHRVDWTVQ